MREDVKILYEDHDVLVVDKPAGLVVNRADTQKAETLQDWVAKYLHIDGQGIGDRCGIVHRLDKETSGVLVIAKTENAFNNLQAQFKERRTAKKYIALVSGKVEPDEGTIEAPVGRNPFNRTRFSVVSDGRDAVTDYKVIALAGDYSLLELVPKTGRTHQIRVHCKYIGHPIVGDELYAGRKTAKKQRTWCPRQFLHAGELTFEHPITGLKKTFKAPLPEDLEKVWEMVKKGITND